METTDTALNTSQRRNWNGLDNCQMYWMWWMKIPIKQTTKVTVKATPMMKATPTMKATCTMKAIHTTKATKINKYPSYPHTHGRMGAMAKDCNHRCR